MLNQFIHSKDKEMAKEISKDCAFYYNTKGCIVIRKKDIAKAIVATPCDTNAMISTFDEFGLLEKTIATTYGNLLNTADQDWLNANRAELIAYQLGEKEIGTIDFILEEERIIDKGELDG